jgi:hypothetical protein
MSESKKDCGCKKKKFSDSPLPNKEPALKKALSMIQSYSMAVASRGLKDKKVDKTVKQLRVLSCFGNEHVGGELPPCVHLKKSATDGKFFCGGCGCGDRKNTWLNGSDEEYSKLDYPSVNCPLSMPGFSNYSMSLPQEAIEPESRKHYIENLDFNSVQKIDVTMPDTPKEVAEILDKVKQRIEEAKNTPPKE